ncbi:tRNA (uridine-5-oxyacetic acid methyl ester) 34 synthase [Hydrogenimonas sp.]|nr:tRNA (uridine-5-oxyacetic acid methyl ester) 34 synthase [Hydrogenimonas sp.]
MRDRIFEKEIEKQFRFDEQVAAVFDDMIERSVPFYRHNMELIADLVLRRVKEGMRIVDLGSSTGSLLVETVRRCGVEAEFIGIDNAEAMVELARKKARAFETKIEFRCEDIMEADFAPADIVIANYTLQFIRPPVRHKAVEKIASSLKEGGMFICSEKILMEDPWLERQIIDIYHSYKRRQGYSETEIMQKREALENVLVPYSAAENVKMFLESGFRSVERLFQWANFATFVAFR